MDNSISFCPNNNNSNKLCYQVRRDQSTKNITTNSRSLNQFELDSDKFLKQSQASNVKFSGLFSKLFNKPSESSTFVNSCNWMSKRIENGGKMVEFIILDLISLILPRTIAGLLRNQDKLGNLNWEAGLEELLRELTTGPSTFLIPLAFIIGARKTGSKSADIGFKFLHNFKNGVKKIGPIPASHEKFKHSLYSNVFKDSLKATFNGKKDLEYKSKGITKTATVEKHAEKLTDKIIKIEAQQQKIANIKRKLSIGEKVRYWFNTKPNTQNLKEIKQANNEISKLKGKILERITLLNKSQGNFNSPHIIKLGDKASCHASNLVENIITYSNDIGKKIQSAAKGKTNATNRNKIIEKIHGKTRYARMLMIMSATISTSIFLILTPKMYQVSKKYPGIAGFDDEDTNNSINPQKKELST